MRRKGKGLIAGLLAFLISLALVAACAPAPPPKKAPAIPEVMTMTAYPVGSAGYAFSAGITEAIKKETGKKIRVIPSGTGVGKLAPLRSGKANFALASGATAFFASMGAYAFSDPAWGPIPLQMIYSGETLINFMVRGDSGIKTIKDLKGKKVAYAPGSPTVNKGNEGMLAFGGLNWDDVEKNSDAWLHSSFKGCIKGHN